MLLNEKHCLNVIQCTVFCLAENKIIYFIGTGGILVLPFLQTPVNFKRFLIIDMCIKKTFYKIKSIFVYILKYSRLSS